MQNSCSARNGLHPDSDSEPELRPSASGQAGQGNSIESIVQKIENQMKSAGVKFPVEINRKMNNSSDFRSTISFLPENEKKIFYNLKDDPVFQMEIREKLKDPTWNDRQSLEYRRVINLIDGG